MNTIQLRTLDFYEKVKDICQKVKVYGHTPAMQDHERTKLAVFNQINLVGVASGVLLPIIVLFDLPELPIITLFVAFLPSIISMGVLRLNQQRQYERARMVFFTLYPAATTMVYLAHVDAGIELFFILYGVLSVFYMKEATNAIIAFALTTGCYSLVFLIKSRFGADLQRIFFPFYVMNHMVAIISIFVTLFWIKKENTGYQFSILKKNRLLHRTNLEIEDNRKVINEKAEQLQLQTDQLTDLNSLKNKLFSVIAHDLKGPLYAQRNLMKAIHQSDMPGDEVKSLVPEILTDMNYTINLMDNLLHWAKCQMQSDPIRPAAVDLSDLIGSVLRVLKLQADAKNIYLESKIHQGTLVFADKDMINLVLRNLLSNAIKFTPEQGTVVVSTRSIDDKIQVCVKDTGRGMRPEELEQLSANTYYTTNGTANESGTGLGLMLCKEFLHKNGSSMQIESKFGKGSTFSFFLPLYQ